MDAATAPPILRLVKCTKCAGLVPATRSALDTAYTCAPLNWGPRMENSLVVKYRLFWSNPSVGWSPKQGQPGPPLWVVSIAYSVHSPVGSLDALTAMSTLDAVPVLLRNRMITNHVLVVES